MEPEKQVQEVYVRLLRVSYDDDKKRWTEGMLHYRCMDGWKETPIRLRTTVPYLPGRGFVINDKTVRRLDDGDIVNELDVDVPAAVSKRSLDAKVRAEMLRLCVTQAMEPATMDVRG